MAAPEYAQWVQRGRAHFGAGRAVDALLCFRRAVRLAPEVSAAHAGLAAALWQLGRVPDAIVAWRDAVRIAPDDPGPPTALAEALLATGAAAEARDVAARVLAKAPHDALAAAIRAVAQLALGEAIDVAAAVVAVTLERAPALAARATLAGPLALALDALAPGAGVAAVLARLAALPDRVDPARRPVVAPTAAAAASQAAAPTAASTAATTAAPRSAVLAAAPENAAPRSAVLAAAPETAALAAAPPLLLALALERADELHGIVVADLVGIARSRRYTAADVPALRRIANAVARHDAESARELAAHYAALAASAFAPAVPLPWPRRTAGDRLRVVALVVDAHDAAPLMALPAARFDVAAASVGAVAVAGARNLLAPAVAPALAVDGERAARDVALFDADVLVDFAGMTAPVGMLLAQRPARAIWGAVDGALANAEPLVDRTVPQAALAAALEAARAALAPVAEGMPDAEALAAMWDAAVRAHRDGDRAAADAGYEAVLAVQPEFAPALFLSGVARRDAGDAAEARARFERAVAVAPAYVEARLAAAEAATAAGDRPRAVMLCEEGTARSPREVRLWRALGHAELARRDGRAAAAAFGRALALEPAAAETHFNQGVALHMERDERGALLSYQRTLALDPRFVAADFNLGVLFQQQGRTDAAIAAYETAIAGDPANAAAYKNLGEVLVAAGRTDAFVANFRRFEARCPGALSLAVQALEACQAEGDFDRLDAYLDGIAGGRFTARDHAELVDCLDELQFLLLYFDVPQPLLLELARKYDAAAQRLYGPPLPQPAARRPGRLRIGYLAADLRNHVMGKQMWAALEHHDRARFELSFWSTSREHDAWTEKYRGLGDRFDVVADLSERAAATRIAAADLDVLVDLSTNTKGGKPGILALKPARVQITHIASAGAVGLSAIDYKLTDRFCEAPDNQRWQIETLLPMDGCVYPYRHVAPAAHHPFHRAPLGIPADAVVIGAFVNALKLSRRCLGLWREILERVPHARLAFSPSAAALRERYVRLAAAAGIAPERLVFVPQGRDDAEGQARYAVVDFALDPLPYGGVNGTIEALDMGVPVVTLVGTRHGERTAYSILANLGVRQTVAFTPRDYVEIAVRLAREPAFMAEVRAAIRAGLASSVLTDMPAHTRALERAYVVALAAKAPAAVAAAEPA